MSQSNTTSVEPTEINDMRDFRLLLTQHDEGLREAVHALYYLPDNYKLVVLNNVAARADFMAWAEQGIIDRIEFEEKETSPEGASPFSFAGAVIYSGAHPNFATEKTPMVVVSEGAADITSNDHHGFTVAAGNPEALATAVMRIARAQA